MTDGGSRCTILGTSGKPSIEIGKAVVQQASVPVAAGATAGGKYLGLPRSPAKSLTSGLSMTTMVDQAFGTPPTLARARVRLVAARYRGQPAWFGRHRSDTVAIARAGEPYLVAMTTKNGQVLRFSGGNTAPAPGPPTASS